MRRRPSSSAGPEEISGLREARDESSTVRVTALPFADASEAAAELAEPRAYVLTGGGIAYIGETTNLGRRLAEHAEDPGKRFATTVYAVTGAAHRLDKATVQHLQARLTSAAEQAALCHLQKGVAPCRTDLPLWRVHSLDRRLPDLFRLAFDLGCRVFHGAEPPPPAALPVDAVPDADADDEADSGRMEIGVSTAPPGTQESELLYGDLWVRGYEHGGRFIVAAGSEIRILSNASVIEKIRRRREQLLQSAVVPIANVADRMRLSVAVAFDSMAIAGKVASGAQLGSDRWRPVRGVPVIYT